MQNGSSLAVLKDTLSPLCGPQRLFIKTAHTADMHSLSCCYSGNSYKKKKSSLIGIYCLFFKNKVSLFRFLKSGGYLSASGCPSPSRRGSGCGWRGVRRFAGWWKALEVSWVHLTSFQCSSSTQVGHTHPPRPLSTFIINNFHRQSEGLGSILHLLPQALTRASLQMRAGNNTAALFEFAPLFFAKLNSRLLTGFTRQITATHLLLLTVQQYIDTWSGAFAGVKWSPLGLKRRSPLTSR